ncbi:MAG: hypothetical protein JSV64_03765 [Candidatus Bathyarchaeota archaeon]|nr:MAG: hypothetical protein JSV64_03765 [Candidatus Bathyarchaeota archaeon]
MTRNLVVLGLIIVTFTFYVRPPVKGDNIRASQPIVYINPPNVTDPTLIPSQNLTIELTVSNVTDLKGFDFQLSWNSSILNYTSHGVKVPVESYPEGILHDPVMELMNQINATAGTCWIAFATIGGPSFNGSGTVLSVTFTIIAFGECLIEITNSDLAGPDGEIMHDVSHGYFSNIFYDVAIISVSPSVTAALIGDIVEITVVALNNGTIRNETFVVSVYYNSSLIDSETIEALPTKANETIAFFWNTSGQLPGTYHMSANASVVSDETVVNNNVLEDGEVTLEIVPFRDIAVVSLIPLKTLVFKGFCFKLNATAENLGNFPEIFNITLYENGTPINQTQLSCDNGAATTITFSWLTHNAIEYESYLLNVTVNISNENVTGNNSLALDNVEIVHPGDLDGDMDVDIFDVVTLASSYGSEVGDPEYDPNSDVDCNDRIDIFDVVMIVPFYGYEKTS